MTVRFSKQAEKSYERLPLSTQKKADKQFLLLTKIIVIPPCELEKWVERINLRVESIAKIDLLS